MRTLGRGRMRLVLAAGTLVAAGALVTAATFTDFANVDVSIDGTRNKFDIVATGRADTSWYPVFSNWHQANPNAFRIALTKDGGPYTMAPGASLDLRVAAKNNSPKLSGLLSLRILDPEPRGNATDPVTGTYMELFDQLMFTVKDGDEVLIDRVPAERLTTISWPEPLNAGEHKLLDVRIELPYSVDNHWQQASTDIKFNFEAVTP